MRLSLATTFTFLLSLGFQTVLASEAVVSAGGTPSVDLCEDTAEAGELACREWAWHGEWYVNLHWEIIEISIAVNKVGHVSPLPLTRVSRVL